MHGRMALSGCMYACTYVCTYIYIMYIYIYTYFTDTHQNQNMQLNFHRTQSGLKIWTRILHFAIGNPRGILWHAPKIH